MRWEGREGSKNVEDRRSMKGSTAALGGGGILVAIIAIVFAMLSGAPPEQALRQGVQQLQQQAAQAAAQGAAGSAQVLDEKEQELEQFVRVVLKDTEDVWNELLPRALGKQYSEPVLVLFRGSVDSACGSASSAVGPFYCPGDQKVYLDLSFFDELRDKLNAPGDFACAYVIAHEIGHHVQNLLGLSMRVQQEQSRVGKIEANRMSVRLELQADFLAGVWAHHAQRMKQILDPGDIGEAIRAAQQIGDDTLQKQATGHVRPDSFTHGSSEQRIKWFSYGLQTGNLDDLNLLFELDYDAL